MSVELPGSSSFSFDEYSNLLNNLDSTQKNNPIFYEYKEGKHQIGVTTPTTYEIISKSPDSEGKELKKLSFSKFIADFTQTLNKIGDSDKNIEQLKKDVRIIQDLNPRVESSAVKKLVAKIFPKKQDTTTLEKGKFIEKANNIIIKHYAGIDLNEKINDLRNTKVTSESDFKKLEGDINKLKDIYNNSDIKEDQNLISHLDTKFKEIKDIKVKAESRQIQAAQEERARAEKEEEPLDPW